MPTSKQKSVNATGSTNRQSANRRSAQPSQLKRIRPTTEKERQTLRPYSNSRLTDINTCPTYGVVHYAKAYSTNARALALEAGSVMHEVFSAVRIWQLEHIQRLPRHAANAAARIFADPESPNRWQTCLAEVSTDLDHREQLLQLAFAILHSSKWYDDPSDRIRTMSNMELAAIAYVDERLTTMDRWPIWVEDARKPNSRVGIEQHFDVVLEYEDGKQIRFIGTIDGLLLDKLKNRLTLDENKTASRLDNAWEATFEIGHQLTGYMAACIAVFDVQVWNARVTGCKIKHTNSGEDIKVIYPNRTPQQILEWGSWVRHTVDMHESYLDPSGVPLFEATPRYTHSCNRYFRPCSFIPFCADTAEGRIEQFESMIETPASPSERAVQDM